MGKIGNENNTRQVECDTDQILMKDRTLGI